MTATSNKRVIWGVEVRNPRRYKAVHGASFYARAETPSQPLIGELVTVRDVPMISTGIDYPTSTGKFTFTQQHLEDLVASQDDPAIHAPRTKIGHSDPRFNATVTKDGEVLDGEPSLATWTNLHLSDDHQTVYGDMTGVPRWLATIMATAYPSRSVEGNFDVETVTGHKWSLAIEAVALLGVIGPGITTLADLPAYFSEEGPDVEVTEAAPGEPMSVIHGSRPTVVAAKPPNLTDGTDTANCGLCCHFQDGNCALWNYAVDASQLCPSFMPEQMTGGDGEGKTITITVNASGRTVAKRVKAQAQVDDIRRQFYESLDSNQFWWWIRAMYIEPNELIVDDDDGGLYRVPFTIGEDGEVTFDDPTAVKIQYVDQPTPAAAAAIRASVASSLHDEPVTTYRVRTDSRPGGRMDLERIRAIRAAFSLTEEQLPDSADDAAVTRVLNTVELNVAAPTGATPAGQGETPPAGTAPATPPTEYPSGTQPVSAAVPNAETAGAIPGSRPLQLPEGTIVVDRETWDTVAQQAAEGAALAASTRENERDRFLNDAVKAGKFPPSRKDHYLKAWEADAEGTRGLIESLQPGLVPVEARGTATAPDDKDRVVAETGYDKAWLTPAERSRIETAAKQDAPALVIQGGD